MKRISFAALALVLIHYTSYAGADEGAYKNLVGMAQSAATDRGPDPDDAPARAPAGPEEFKDAVADVPSPRAAPAPTAAPGGSSSSRSAPVFSEAPVRAPAPAAAPAAPKPRFWTRLYSTLLPSWRRPPSLQSAFDPVLSTAAVRATLPAAMPSSGSEAVSAGERRGLSELMSVPAPARPQ